MKPVLTIGVKKKDNKVDLYGDGGAYWYGNLKHDGKIELWDQEGHRHSAMKRKFRFSLQTSFFSAAAAPGFRRSYSTRIQRLRQIKSARV